MDMQLLPTSALGEGAVPSPPTSLQFVGRGMEATARIKQIEKIRKLIHTHVKLSWWMLDGDAAIDAICG